jgi:hypothetical protein
VFRAAWYFFGRKSPDAPSNPPRLNLPGVMATETLRLDFNHSGSTEKRQIRAPGFPSINE